MFNCDEQTDGYTCRQTDEFVYFLITDIKFDISSATLLQVFMHFLYLITSFFLSTNKEYTTFSNTIIHDKRTETGK